ncbi:MAG: hypothetical protein ACI9YH_000010 [Colwellia sp.]|jgi:hypothetical protein
MSLKNKSLPMLFCICVIATITACGGGSGSKPDATPAPVKLKSLTSSVSNLTFESTRLKENSPAQNFILTSANLSNIVSVNASTDFEISKNNIDFYSSLNLNTAELNQNNFSLYTRFSPKKKLANISGNLVMSSTDFADVTISLSGQAIESVTHNYATFSKQRIAFGGGNKRTQKAVFNLHDDVANIQAIKMYVKLDCPSQGCNAWDVYANVKVKVPDTNSWLELGRYITPYGVDNSQLSRGFEFDVTDFKSLLQGSTELQIKVDTWGQDGWQVSVDFGYVEGQPDYPFYYISPLLNFMGSSQSGVPYGIEHSFDLVKNVLIDGDAESVSLRTIISGWGHATPKDSDGRGCAEWCYRTHQIKINQIDTFSHELGPLGCSENPVTPQSGNWAADRAGWCPGMAVPVRVDMLGSTASATPFMFEYKFADWITDGGHYSGDPGAFYAISSYIVVKSNTLIVIPTVID